MKLWIDDLRPAPEGWVWAKTSAEALALIAGGVIDAVSFDHDLGGDDTTRPVALWFEEFGYPPEVYIHTANPIGRDWLIASYNSWLRRICIVCHKNINGNPNCVDHG